VRPLPPAVTADWLFVIGIAFEISGAVLVAGGFIFSSRRDQAVRGMTFPTGGPVLAAQRERAFAYVGATVLGIGFIVQLVGYIADSGDYWFIAVAVVLVATGVIGGRRVVEHLADFLQRASVTYAELQRRTERD
jgi:hypothetical protein